MVGDRIRDQCHASGKGPRRDYDVSHTPGYPKGETGTTSSLGVRGCDDRHSILTGNLRRERGKLKPAPATGKRGRLLKGVHTRSSRFVIPLGDDDGTSKPKGSRRGGTQASEPAKWVEQKRKDRERRIQEERECNIKLLKTDVGRKGAELSGKEI